MENLETSRIERYLIDRQTNNYLNSANSVRRYRRILIDYMVLTGGELSDGGATTFRDHLVATKDGDQIKACLYVLSGYCKWAGTYDPFGPLVREFRVDKKESQIKKQIRDERVLSERDVLAMLDHAKRNTVGKDGIAYYVAWRNLFILRMLSEYGMRIDALVKADLEHVDMVRRSMVIVASKNQEPYPVPIVRMVDTIRDYLSVRRRQLHNIVDQDALLLSRTGRRLSDTSARRAMNAIAESAGVYEPQRSTHQLRHYRATRYSKEGMSPELIATIMGMSVQTLRSTYLHITHDDIVNEYEAWARKKDQDGTKFVCPQCGYGRADRPTQLHLVK